MRMIALLLILISSQVFAELPKSAEEVRVIEETVEPIFENIPRIKKIFKGAQSIDEKLELQHKCQDWVMNKVSEKAAPYFRVWCSLKKDVVLREYAFTGNLLIQNWSSSR